MLCTPIDKKYKNSKCTFLIVLVSTIILHLMIQTQTSLINVSSAYGTIALLLTTFTFGSYVFLYDPTMLCGVLQNNCRRNVALMGLILTIVNTVLIYYLIKQLLGSESPWCFYIPLIALICGICVSWFKYSLDTDTLLNDPINVLKCHRTRLLFYMIIVALDLFNALQFYKYHTSSDQLSMSFGLPVWTGIIIYPLYIFFSIIFPSVNDILALDGAVKYDISEITAT
jgi:hypothetical protein